MDDLQVEVEQKRDRGVPKKYPFFSLHNLFTFFFFFFYILLFGVLMVITYFWSAFYFGDAVSGILLVVMFLLLIVSVRFFHRRRRTVFSNVPSKRAVVSTFGQFLDPVNLVLIFGNIFIFVLVQTLFFWFVASRNTIDSAKDLTDLAISVVGESGKLNGCQLPLASENGRYQFFRQNFDPLDDDKWGGNNWRWTDSKVFLDLKDSATREKLAREERNVNPTLQYIGTFEAVVLLLILVNVFRAIKMGRKFTKIEFVLFLATVLAFLTELSFYFLVVRSVQYIGEFEAIAELRFPYETSDISGIVDPYVKYGSKCDAI